MLTDLRRDPRSVLDAAVMTGHPVLARLAEDADLDVAGGARWWQAEGPRVLEVEPG